MRARRLTLLVLLVSLLATGPTLEVGRVERGQGPSSVTDDVASSFPDRSVAARTWRATTDWCLSPACPRGAAATGLTAAAVGLTGPWRPAVGSLPGTGSVFARPLKAPDSAVWGGSPWRVRLPVDDELPAVVAVPAPPQPTRRPRRRRPTDGLAAVLTERPEVQLDRQRNAAQRRAKGRESQTTLQEQTHSLPV